MGRRMLALLLAGLVALAPGCAWEGQGSFSTQSRTLRLWVGPGAGSPLAEQAELFARQAAEYAEGSLAVEAVWEEPEAGGWELALLDGGQLAQAAPVFAMFSLPFLYDSWEHLGRALNDRQLLGSLSRQLEGVGLRPLAALYGGSPRLVTAGPELRTPVDFRYLTLALGEGQPQQEAAFQALGARVVSAPAGQAAALLGRTAEDAGPVEAAEASLAQAQALAGQVEGLTLINSCHATAPLWLVARSESWEQLPERQQAAVLEALAGLSGRMALQAQEEERTAREALEAAGAALVEVERPLLAQAVYEGGGYQLPDFFDRQLYDWIQEYA